MMTFVRRSMILHIPHSSDFIPPGMRKQFLLSETELSTELNLLTDKFTDELFAFEGGTFVRFPISRLIVDVERFESDADEAMSNVGMGVIYTRTTDGKQLKHPMSRRQKNDLIDRYYIPHHQKLLSEVKQELAMNGYAVIVDCHSFPNQPLPCDTDQSEPRPHFCIGTDSFHTPTALVDLAMDCLKKTGYTVKINEPYSGTLVPMEHFKKETMIISIMIEINRSLYMDEETGEKNDQFYLIQAQIENLLREIARYEV